MISRKVCLMGAFSVGKSSLLRRFVHEVFDDRYITTLGVKIETKQIKLESESVKLVVWDMEGAVDEGADGQLVTPRMQAYLKGAHGVLLVADGTRKNTLDIAQDLHQWIEAHAPGTPAALLLNKCDLVDQWCVGEAEMAGLPAALQCFTTSALSGENVESTFEYLARKLSESE